jgi:peptidoglycan/xylan/chitin deacetylase (PgdA/CDA1 family)
MSGFYQAFLFLGTAGFLLGSLPWWEVARALRSTWCRLHPKKAGSWSQAGGRSETAVSLILVVGELAVGAAVAVLALAVTGSAVGVVLAGLAAIAGSQWPAFGRLHRPPFHYLRLGPATIRVDRSLLLTTGLLAATLPLAALTLATLFSLALLVTRRPPLSAILAALTLPPLLWRVTGYDLWALFGGAVALMAVYREIPYLLRTPGASHRQSRRTASLARVAFLTLATACLTLALLNRWVYRGFGAQLDVFRHGNPHLPYVALTFDDGPDPRYTPQVLRILQSEQVPATFFLVGAHAERYPGLVRRIQREGHEIGSHTYSHRNLFLLPERTTEQEVARAEAVLTRLTGARPHLFRPPRGLYDGGVRRLLQAHRYTVVLWSVSSRDWAEVSPRLIAANVLGPVRGGDILLFHDSGAILASQGGNRQHMLQALPYVIGRLKAEGFQFVTVSQLQFITALTAGDS